ncbi:hypothetical protein JCM8547_005838 [Rhodosporidiobolus lusitaniae]
MTVLDSAEATSPGPDHVLPPFETEVVAVGLPVTRTRESIMEEVVSKSVQLVAFGELWLPGYPSFLYAKRMNDVFAHGIKYGNNAVELEGPELKAIAEAAKRLRLITHVGFTERDGRSLYMANAIFDENGNRILHRRKIKPSHYERVLFGEGGPESAITTVETSIGRVWSSTAGSTFNRFSRTRPITNALSSTLPHGRCFIRTAEPRNCRCLSPSSLFSAYSSSSSSLPSSSHPNSATPPHPRPTEALVNAFATSYLATLGLPRDAPPPALAVVTDVGGSGALAKIMKVRQVMKDEKTEWTAVGELPVEIPLPLRYRYHAVFACPVSKEQSTANNPPMLMPCGNVIAKESLGRLATGTPTLKCPYSPVVSHFSACVRVHF